MALTATLTSVLIILLMGWVTTFSRIVADTPATAASQTTADLTQTRLRADLAAATPCDSLRLNSPLVEISPTSLSLNVDTNADGFADLVTWDVSGADLTRSTQTAVGPCEYENTTETVLLSGEVLTASNYFFPRILGVEETLTVAVTCVGVPSPCDYDAVTTRVGVRIDSESAPVMVEHTALLKSDALIAS